MGEIAPLRYFLRLADRDVYALHCKGSSPRFDQEVGTARKYLGSAGVYLAIVEIPSGSPAVITWNETILIPSGLFRLVDPEMESKRFPLEITVEAHNALDMDDQDHYRRDYTRTEEPRSMVLAAEQLPFASEVPALPAGVKWVPAEAYSTVFGPVGEHLYPGMLVGFDAGAYIRSLGVEYYDHETGPRATEFKCRVKIWWDPPRMAKVKGVRGKSGEQATWYTRDLRIPRETSWTGKNQAAALEKLNAYIAQITDLIEENKAVKVCSHCDGYGMVGIRESL